jgi:hypothetical protein
MKRARTKLDTVVINRKIDELGRPVPNLIRRGIFEKQAPSCWPRRPRITG